MLYSFSEICLCHSLPTADGYGQDGSSAQSWAGMRSELEADVMNTSMSLPGSRFGSQRSAQASVV